MSMSKSHQDPNASPSHCHVIPFANGLVDGSTVRRTGRCVPEIQPIQSHTLQNREEKLCLFQTSI